MPSPSFFAQGNALEELMALVKSNEIRDHGDELTPEVYKVGTGVRASVMSIWLLPAACTHGNLSPCSTSSSF
jgi:hypothetical protein